jgi:hypothetical protein
VRAAIAQAVRVIQTQRAIRSRHVQTDARSDIQLKRPAGGHEEAFGRVRRIRKDGDAKTRHIWPPEPSL